MNNTKMDNPYQPLKATLETIITETPNIKTFVMKPEKDFSFKTGQFIEVSFPGFGEGPFTPSSDPEVKNRLEVTIMNVGRLTSKLHSLSGGEVLGIRGPYGKGYPLDKFVDKDVLIVGGGVGLAPLRSLLFALFSDIKRYNKVILRYGARSPQDIVYKNSLPEWGKREKVDVLVTVDVGDNSWKGNVGLVTSILKDLPLEISRAVAVVCGPPIMMKFVTLKLVDLGFGAQDIYLSMEKNMSCGLGKCGHCRLGKYYVCRDGPVFTYQEMKDMHDIWD
ncbi:MAG: FAD/NAD(P)-binding protein [Candidatus Omnitrophica bacterium]|nr:FAD/NAD(P)-binding protein [Candidatus Omnitrophota bacterium]